jgi:hypothetical protein
MVLEGLFEEIVSPLWRRMKAKEDKGLEELEEVVSQLWRRMNVEEEKVFGGSLK